MNPSQAEVDAVARALLATVPEPPEVDFDLPAFLRPIPKTDLDRLMEAALRIGQQRARRRADGCTCPAAVPGKARTFDLYCPDTGHRRLAMAARHRRC